MNAEERSGTCTKVQRGQPPEKECDSRAVMGALKERHNAVGA
jgi:hypothetical protein